MDNTRTVFFLPKVTYSICVLNETQKIETQESFCFGFDTASGEPPLLLAASVHCAVRAAVKEAKKQILTWSDNQQGIDVAFDLPVPATMPVVKESCGLDVVEKYLEWKIQQRKNV